MNTKLKTIRNVLVFGIILYIVNYGLNFLINKIFSVFKLDSLYDTNIILYAIITIGLGFILYLIAMLITKKIVSIKIKIDYEEAKKMLLILLIIFFIVNVITFIVSYNKTIKEEEKLNSTISELETLRESKEYKKFDKSTKETVESMYKIYVENKDEILELENQRKTLIAVELISNIFLYVVCLYAFGLFLYRKD